MQVLLNYTSYFKVCFFFKLRNLCLTSSDHFIDEIQNSDFGIVFFTGIFLLEYYVINNLCLFDIHVLYLAVII